VAVAGAGKESYEMAYDGPCAARRRGWIRDHGTKLEDRTEFGGLGPQTNLSSAAVWASLGITPRG
jgi:hypothetical protein